MQELKASIKRSIEQRLQRLEEEEKSLNSYYQGRMRVADDGYYVSYARNKAKSEALQAQRKIDEIIEKKLALLKELQAL